MAWIQVDDSIREHDKIYNLADVLNISNAYAVGLMVCFWTWAAVAAPDGDVTNFPPRAISQAAGWDKDGAKGAQEFYNDLLKIRFLEKHDDGTVHIRNWEQHAALLLDYIDKQKEKTRRRVQKYREKKRENVTLHVTQSKAQSVTQCNVTETLQKRNVTPLPIPKSTLPKSTLPESNNNTPSASTAEGVTPDAGAGKDFGRVCQAFEDTVNPMPSSKDGMILSELYRDYPVQRVLDAIDETARCQGRSAAYVRSVLQNEDRKAKAPPNTGPDLTDPNRYRNFGK